MGPRNIAVSIANNDKFKKKQLENQNFYSKNETDEVFDYSKIYFWKKLAEILYEGKLSTTEKSILILNFNFFFLRSRGHLPLYF